MQKISTCLWFDHQAEEAAKFYTSLFHHGKIGHVARYSPSGENVSGQKAGTVMTVEFEIDGQHIIALNGGPLFKFSQALSYIVAYDSEKELEILWKRLSEGGIERMPLGKYPWAEKYGWTADRFGVEWQLIRKKSKQRITPAFLFVDKLFGKGEEAVQFYMSEFRHSEVVEMTRDPSTNSIMYCTFSLNGQEFALMEGQGKHNFTFTPAFSFVVHCRTQEEIDAYWGTLSKGGTPERCGWLKDRYGVSWQIVPTALAEMMTDPKRSEPVMAALMKMTKLDLSQLRHAYEHGK